MKTRWKIAVVGLIICLCAVGARADSLFAKASADNGTLISDTTQRFEVGDLITVMVRENTTATTQSDTDTKKESDLESTAIGAANPFLTDALGVDSDLLPNWLLEAENEFKTQGSTKRSNQLVMTVTCSVKEVSQNGIVVIEGTKSVTVNREESGMKINGSVRARDVQPDNTVDSNLIANARVELIGNGPLWRNQKRGFLTRILDWFNPN